MEYIWINRKKTIDKQKHLFKVVKMLFFFLFILSVNVNAYTFAQMSDLSLKLKNSTIKEAFDEIEKNSDYIFILLDNDNMTKEIGRKVDIDAKSINEILALITNNTDLDYDIYNKQVVVYNNKTKISEPDVVAPYQMNQFQALGSKADYLICEPNEVDLDENLKKLDSVNVVFFSGGDQTRLVEYLEGTKFLQKIHKIYENGGVVSGTSAGAAVMSEVMINGKQYSDSSESPAFDKIKKGDVLTSNGFGFLKNIIIDQHFLIRKRENRLFSVLKDYPTFRGIGIDEATAIVIKPDNTMSVVGNSQVLIFEPLYREPNELNEYVIKILKDGDNYEL